MGGGCSRSMPFKSAAPSGDSGSPVMRAAKSRAASPARSVAPTPEPAEVPTITAAVRGSHPVTSAIVASVPAW